MERITVEALLKARHFAASEEHYLVADLLEQAAFTIEEMDKDIAILEWSIGRLQAEYPEEGL